MKNNYALACNLILLICFSVFISCTVEDDDDTVTYYVENNTLISIENNQNEINVDDILFIETAIDPIQTTTNNQSINITDLIYEPENGPLNYSITLYRENSLGSIIKVPIAEEHIISDIGNVYSSNNPEYPVMSVETYFNNGIFYSRFGIRFTESGTYYVNSENLNQNYVRINGGDYNLGYVKIQSKIVNSDTDGFYQITVN